MSTFHWSIEGPPWINITITLLCLFFPLSYFHALFLLLSNSYSIWNDLFFCGTRILLSILVNFVLFILLFLGFIWHPLQSNLIFRSGITIIKDLLLLFPYLPLLNFKTLKKCHLRFKIGIKSTFQKGGNIYTIISQLFSPPFQYLINKKIKQKVEILGRRIQKSMDYYFCSNPKTTASNCIYFFRPFINGIHPFATCNPLFLL